MPGGILQLISKNIEDSILVGDPEITLFKTIYKRHTNYSKYEHKINFESNINFGSDMHLKLKNYGDLLSNLTLVLDLPEIFVYYPLMTRYATQKLLNNYNINVSFMSNNDEPINNNELENISVLIDNKIFETQQIIDKLNNIIDVIEVEFDPDINVVVLLMNINDYYDEFIKALMNFENNNFFFTFITALIKDNVTPIELVTCDILQMALFHKIREYDDNWEYFLKTIPGSYISDIYKFISNVEFGIYNCTISQNNLTIFNSTIDNIYENLKNLPNIISQQYVNYKSIDSYKIYYNFLSSIKYNIREKSELEQTRINIVESMLINIKNNYSNLINTFTSLINKHNVILLKQIRTQQGANMYNVSSSFVNLSEINNNIIDDKISKYFEYDHDNQYELILNKYINVNFNSLLKAYLNILQDTLFSEYFKNDINTLWKRLSISTIMIVPQLITDHEELDSICLLNFIPLIVIEDAQKLLLDYVENIDGFGGTLYTSLETLLNSEIPNLIVLIKQHIFLSTDELTELVTVAKFNKKSSNDILLLCVAKQNIYINNKPIPLHISDVFKLILANFILINNISDIVVVDCLNLIVDSFCVSEIPLYSQYKKKYRIYDNGITDYVPVADCAGLIWTKISDQINKKFNIFYNNILNNNYFENNIGIEFNNYVTEICFSNTSLISNVYKIIENNYTYIDYAKLSSDVIYYNDITVNNIINYLTSKQSINDDFYQKYNSYKKILRVKNIMLKYSHFEKTQIIFDKMSLLIRHNDYFGYNNDVDDKLDIFLLGSINSLSNYLTAENVVHNFKNDFLLMLSGNTNPYQQNSFLYEWYNDNDVSNLSQQFKNDTELYLDDLCNNLSSTDLYKAISLLYNKFNGLKNDNDVFNYIKYLLMIKTQHVSNFIFSFEKYNSIKLLYEHIYEHFNKKLNDNKSMLSEIDNTDPDDLLNNLNNNKLYTKIKNSMTNTKGKFSWVNWIGHFIIDTMTLKIGDQIIDRHSGEWLHVNRELNKRSENETGYSTLIGNVDVLTSYDTNMKPKYRLYIPIQFWFCKRTESSLPMISLFLTETNINVKLKDLSSVAKWDKNCVFNKTPEINGFIIAQYIYIDTLERELITKNKHEQLIEITQCLNDEFVNINDLTINNDIYFYEKKLHFSNLCKEIIWTIQDINLINLKQYSVFGYSIDNKNKSIVTKIKIQFNGKDRETYKDSEYYTFCVPYKTHTSLPNIGTYVYNYALFPENIQPSGCVNMSRIDKVALLMQIDDNYIIDMIENNKNFKITAYSVGYNILRIMSGMAGLAFN